MRARIPSLEKRPWLHAAEQPSLHEIMDMIEFCWRSIGKPIKRGYHNYFKHEHLAFDVDDGQAEFREAINEIVRRNGLAFELSADGTIERLAPPALREALASASFATGDHLLDGMLEDARQKFMNPDEAVRREGLEKLWDAFERIKTLEPGAGKAVQAKLLLDKVAGKGGPKFRQLLDSEASALTNIHIRHSETTQELLSSAQQIDYLFHRLFAFITLLLRDTNRM